jgi:hypothetical protein
MKRSTKEGQTGPLVNGASVAGFALVGCFVEKNALLPSTKWRKYLSK